MNPNDARGEQPICRRCGGPIQRRQTAEELRGIGKSWMRRGLGWIGVGVAAAVIAPIAPVALIAGGLAVAGGTVAVGAGAIAIEGADNQLRKKCPECENSVPTGSEPEKGGKQLPEGVGMFLDRFDKTLLSDILTDLRVLSNGMMVSDKINKTVNAVNITVEMKESKDQWIAKCDPAFLKTLEETYKIVIQAALHENQLPQDDSPADDNMPYGFNRKDIKVEGVDKSGKYVVKFCNTNITTYPAEAMVNSSKPDLAFDSGLAKKVGEEAGPEVVRECEDFIRHNGKLDIGEVFATKGGNLDCKYIFHVASPFWGLSRIGYDPKKLLILATKNILREANAKSVRELATPAISSSGFGFSVEESLLSIFTGIDEYFKESDNTGLLKYITLVDINADVTKEVEQTMKKIFGTEYVLDEKAKQCKNRKSVTCKIIGGTDDIVKKVIKELKDKCDGVFGPVVNYPATWSPMSPGEPYLLTELPSNSVDYMQLKDSVAKYIPQAIIKKIERVQHPKLYDDMMDYKKNIINEVGSWLDKYEMKLWHGTRKASAEKIKLDTLRKPKSERQHGALYGRGIYFGPDPEVSNFYAGRGSETRYLFRCTVMVGNINRYTHHKEAPPDATEAPQGHHSIQVRDPKFGMEHIVFNETQACPDYLITYKDLS